MENFDQKDERVLKVFLFLDDDGDGDDDCDDQKDVYDDDGLTDKRHKALLLVSKLLLPSAKTARSAQPAPEQ